MKHYLLVSTLALALAYSAHAEVKRPGTFVPDLCSGPDESISSRSVNVKSVCVGEIVGFVEHAVEITDQKNKTHYYDVGSLSSASPHRMGDNKRKFKGPAVRKNGEEIDSDSIEGVLDVSSGITLSFNLSLRTESKMYFAGPVAQVFITE